MSRFNVSLVNAQQFDQCLICGANKLFVALNGAFKVIECRDCKYGHVLPVPQPSELKKLYDSAEYFGEHMAYEYSTMSSADIEHRIGASGKLHMQKLAPLLSSGSKILEIGPGGGFALKYFERLGHRVFGIETSASSVAFAKARLKIDLDHCDLESYQGTTEFDLIILNHVLEHFVDVRSAISKIHSLTRQKGLVYVRVPNHDSYDRRVMGARWPAYLPFHISYFSEASLRLLFQQSGLAVIAVDEFLSEEFARGMPRILRGVCRRLVSNRYGSKIWNGRTIRIVARKN